LRFLVLLFTALAIITPFPLSWLIGELLIG